MERRVRIQAQSVLYHNDLGSIEQTIAAMANAARVSRERWGMDLEVVCAYGDSGETPLVSEEQLSKWQTLAGKDLTVTYRFFGFNAGSAGGQNLLAAPYEGDYVLIMNPDVKVSPDFFHYMLLPFEHGKTGVVEARQSPVEHHKFYAPGTGETDWCTGACSLIRNAVFREVGGFDEKTFFLYCDDVDLSWRIKAAGYQLIYQPHAMVYHAKELSSDAGWMPGYAEQFYSAEASLLMAYKWCNEERLHKLIMTYRHGSEVERDALRSYQKRKKEGRIPERIHVSRKIATFTGDHYSRDRFTY